MKPTFKSRAKSTSQRYEEVAEHLLNVFREHFNLERVESKQLIDSESGTVWEVDSKGVRVGDEAIIVVECKRHTKKNLSQAILGSLAFSIRDIGASGGIIVSPLELQAGAKKIATHTKIQTSST